MTRIIERATLKNISAAHRALDETKRVYLSGDYIDTRSPQTVITSSYQFEHKPLDGFTNDALLVTLHLTDETGKEFDEVIEILPLDSRPHFQARAMILPNLYRNSKQSL